MYRSDSLHLRGFLLKRKNVLLLYYNGNCQDHFVIGRSSELQLLSKRFAWIWEVFLIRTNDSLPLEKEQGPLWQTDLVEVFSRHDQLQ